MEGFHDKIFVNDNLETTYKELENYIFGLEDTSEDTAQSNSGEGDYKPTEATNAEVEMGNGEISAPAESSTNKDASLPEEQRQ